MQAWCSSSYIWILKPTWVLPFTQLVKNRNVVTLNCKKALNSFWCLSRLWPQIWLGYIWKSFHGFIRSKAGSSELPQTVLAELSSKPGPFQSFKALVLHHSAKCLFDPWHLFLVRSEARGWRLKDQKGWVRKCFAFPVFPPGWKFWRNPCSKIRPIVISYVLCCS